uniref:Liprin-beta-1/2 coiled-coil domain-containing protein n=1 Tax=Neolamprologus brichardi TaxID=32507 RepID=A0A3Q4MGS3_NEOBR
MASNASHMLEAALEQMDDIIAGKRECENSFQQLTLPPPLDPALKALQLTEALRAVLEGQGNEEGQDALRKQVSDDTADIILKWLGRGGVNLHSNANSESYQERLSRLEGDKESLILQVSVLTDQVEAQGVKINDLESSLMEHRHKLNSTEEMLQQELLHRASLENQKLSLMGEVSYLKLKLADMEEKQGHGGERHHKAEVWLLTKLNRRIHQISPDIYTPIKCTFLRFSRTKSNTWRIRSYSTRRNSKQQR